MAYDALAAQAWPVRFARAFVASSVSLSLAVTGHRVGGGDVVSAPIILGVFATVFAITVQLSRRQLTAGQIVGLLLIAQIVIHLGCAMGESASSFGLTMIAGHAMATALSAAALARGERCLWALADLLGLAHLNALLNPGTLTTPFARLRFRRRDARPPNLNVLVGGIGLRGPPVNCH